VQRLRRNFEHATRRGREGREGDAMSKSKKRNVFGELMEGVRAMRSHREGRITLRSHYVPALSLPPVDEHVIRTTRERLHMSRAAFAHKLGVNPRTLELWEQGRSKPNDQAIALILLVRKYPDTLSRLESLAAAG
jgi:putative transcriptional regulator